MVDAVRAIARHGVPRLASGFVYYRAFPLSYAGWAAARLFGNFREPVLRLPVILGGTAAVFLFYLIARRLVSGGTALLAAAIVALSPWEVVYSFFFRFYVFLPLLFLGITYMIYEYLRTAGRRWLFGIVGLWVVFASLSRQSLLGVVHLPLLLGVALWRPEKKRRVLGLVLVIAVLSAGDYALSAKIQGRFFARFSTLAPAAASVPLPPREEKLEGRVTGVIAAFSPFLARKYSVVRKQFFPTPYYLEWFAGTFPAGVLLAGGGLIYFWRRRRLEAYFPATLAAALGFLSLANPIGKFQPRYVFAVSLLYFLVVALAAEVVGKRIGGDGKKWRWLAVGLLLVLTSDLNSLGSLWRLDYGSRLRGTMAVSESYPRFPDTKSAVEYVNEHYREGDVVVSLQPRTQTLVYLKPRLDYYLRTRNFEGESYLLRGRRVDDYNNVEILTSAEELAGVVARERRRGGRVFLISSDSERLDANHIDGETARFLRDESDRVVQTSAYEFAKVYVFE
jgi:hypothetical protein